MTWKLGKRDTVDPIRFTDLDLVVTLLERMNLILSLSELIGSEVALLRVDPFTGVPVNDAGEWLRAGEERYLRFDVESQAREFAGASLLGNPLCEWMLFGSDGRLVDTLNDV